MTMYAEKMNSMNNQVEAVEELVQGMGGWLTSREGNVLFNLARSCAGEGVIVEIGSYKGKSTTWLGTGSQAGNKIKVYAIDPHTDMGGLQPGRVPTFQDFQKNIASAGLTDIVVPIVKTSEEAARGFDQPIELIFIDGAHDYESVKKDFEIWFPKVIDGGIMAFHDTIEWIRWPKSDSWLYDGPKKFVKSFLFNSRIFRDVTFVIPGSSITYGRKVKENSLQDRLRSRLVLLMKEAYESAGMVRREVGRQRG